MNIEHSQAWVVFLIKKQKKIFAAFFLLLLFFPSNFIVISLLHPNRTKRMDEFPSTPASSPFYTHKGANDSVQLMHGFSYYFIVAILV